MALENRFARDQFRIYFSSRPERVAGRGSNDNDLDGVPDKIQDVALRLVIARRLLVEALGLQHALRFHVTPDA